MYNCSSVVISSCGFHTGLNLYLTVTVENEELNIFIVPLIIVVAPHHFDAEPDPDSTYYPDGGSGF
jgi:hypothetical protein